MEVGWLLIAVLGLIVLALEVRLRLSGRARGSDAPPIHGPFAERASSGNRAREVIPSTRDPVVAIANRRGLDRASAAKRMGRARVLEAATILHAPAARVWDTLSDFAAYPCWNPYIAAIIGDVREGSCVDVTVRPPDRPRVTYRARLIEARAGRGFRWRTRLLLPGLLDHEHQCLIESLTEDSVQLLQRDVYTGLLVWLLPPSLDASTVQGLRIMHAALRTHVEGGVRR